LKESGMNILLAVDGSEFTKRMLAYLGAHDELVGPKNRFTILTAVPPVPPHVTQFIGSDTLASYYAEQAEAVLQPIRRYAEQQGWEWTTRHDVGHPSDVIAKAADSGEHDLLVLGSHGHGAIKSLVLGSVASGVLARCKIPVLIVR
jgi:nucleotide-binding universal stress UspA family protein